MAFNTESSHTDFFDYERIEDLSNKDTQNFYTETKTVLINFTLPGYFEVGEYEVAFMVKADDVKNSYCMLMNEEKGFRDFLIRRSMWYLSQYKGRASQIIPGSDEWEKFADVYITLRLLNMIVRNDPIPFFLK